MILVTGATGLVGSHLLAKLLQTEQGVKALYRSAPKQALTKKILSYYFAENTELYFSKIEWVQADITDIPALNTAFNGVSQVYHCAGLISFDPSDELQLRKINIEGTANVVNLCLAFKVEKLCHVSSIAALGKELSEKPITEDTLFEGDGKHSDYAITKFGGEMEVWRGSQEGLEVVIVNPGIIIGPGDWDHGSGLLFKKIASGLNYYFPKITGFVAVEDVAKAMVGLMQKPMKNNRYILVGENLSFKTLFFEIAKSLKKKTPSKKLRPWMVFLGWIFQWIGNKLVGIKRQVSKESIKGLFETSIYSSSKIKKELDFEFFPIESCIQKTGKLFLKEQTN